MMTRTTARLSWMVCVLFGCLTVPMMAQDKGAPKAAADVAVSVGGPVIPDTKAGKVMERVVAALADPSAEIGEGAFSESFSKQVPYGQIKQIIKALHDEHGAFDPVKVEKQDGERGLVLIVKTAKTQSNWQILLNIDENDKIQGLLLRPAGTDEPPLKDWADFDTRLGKLPGKQNFGAYELTADDKGGTPQVTPVHLFNADTRLALGSTFKLYVLGALAESVQSGKRHWDDKLAIKDAWKSLPSGKMQNEKEGTEFPLSYYADQMISISDNTATDHLIRLLRRDTVEQYMSKTHGKPEINRPFLTTRDVFSLKLSTDSTLADRWLVVGEAERLDMLEADDPIQPHRKMGRHHTPGEVANTNPEFKAAEKWVKPRHIDTIEWFASADELAKVMADLSRLERLPGMDPLGHAMRINPGLPFDTKKWIKIAFKGGSEPGVLNLTFLLTRADGKMFVLTIGWNDTAAALDEKKLMGLVTRAAERLAE